MKQIIKDDRTSALPSESLLFLSPEQIRVPKRKSGTAETNEIIRLSESIRRYGVLQPLSIRAIRDSQGQTAFELVEGERRYRAACLIGLQELPCSVLEAESAASRERQEAARIKESSLHFFDQARAFAALSNEFGLTQEEISRRMDLSQSTVANKLRLLQFSKEEEGLIREARLTERHARALLRVKNPIARKELLQKIIQGKKNVAASEKMIDDFLASGNLCSNLSAESNLGTHPCDSKMGGMSFAGYFDCRENDFAPQNSAPQIKANGKTVDFTAENAIATHLAEAKFPQTPNTHEDPKNSEEHQTIGEPFTGFVPEETPDFMDFSEEMPYSGTQKSLKSNIPDPPDLSKGKDPSLQTTLNTYAQERRSEPAYTQNSTPYPPKPPAFPHGCPFILHKTAISYPRKVPEEEQTYPQTPPLNSFRSSHGTIEPEEVHMCKETDAERKKEKHITEGLSTKTATLASLERQAPLFKEEYDSPANEFSPDFNETSHGVYPRKFALRDLRPLYNSIERTLAIFRKTGAPVHCSKTEDATGARIVIYIEKA